VLSRSLAEIEALAAKGEHRACKLRAAALEVLASEPEAQLDYFEIVDADTLEPVEVVDKGALVAVAASFGATRLIDNLMLPSR
jgi:pantoate--beta-alanine ligase